MLQEEEDIDLAPKEREDEQKKKAEGEELRKRACETLGETRKRYFSEDFFSLTNSRCTPCTSCTTCRLTLKLLFLLCFIFHVRYQGECSTRTTSCRLLNILHG